MAEEFDRTDRLLLGVCAAVWLVALGAAVAATVALVDLGTGHAQSTGDSQTPWLLYAVIAISAAVIIGAVPLLLRARRAAQDAQEESAPPARAPIRTASLHPAAPARGAEAPTEKIRIAPAEASGPGYPTREAFAPTRNPLAGKVDQLRLRCSAGIAIAMGAATVAIGIATYSMAVDHDGVAWAFYVLAGILTLGMPAIMWFFLRELRTSLEPSDG